MGYMVCQHPGVRMDLMVLERYWPKLAGAFERVGCTYFKEDKVRLINGNNYVILRDVRAIEQNNSRVSRNMGELLGLFYALEWDALSADDDGEIKGQQKFYILIKPRKKGKKHVQKDRTETGAGSESGNTGEPGDIQSGEDPGCGGSGNHAAGAGSEHAEQLSFFEALTGDTYSGN